MYSKYFPSLSRDKHWVSQNLGKFSTPIQKYVKMNKQSITVENCSPNEHGTLTFPLKMPNHERFPLQFQKSCNDSGEGGMSVVKLECAWIMILRG